MPRRPTAARSDSYLTRIITYIPTEIIAAYVAVSGIVKSLPDSQQFLWFSISAVALLLLTPLWILDAASQKSLQHPVGQAVAATLAFAAWVFATGGPFNRFIHTWYHPAMGSLVLVFVCLCLPMVERALSGSSSAARATQ